mmetsp:Transcript_21184/g.59912  ORF Transcript_21184/g.59912 Transcript_21184/m.59912 type:complete len:539 (-) Transcript_21184:85-1701(-)
MPEVHPGTDIELGEGVATSGFRCAIPNTKRYMKKNKWTVDDVAKAAYEGDLPLLETLLSTGDESTLFNGDVNAHVEAEKGITKSSYTSLHLAAVSGQTECIELLLKAKADPHVKESMPYGQDPEEGSTALDLAKKYGWDDCIELLEQGEKSYPYGYYQAFGKGNNSKCYDCWEHGKKPAKGWYMMRPGAAQQQGLDPKKYGGELAEPEDEGADLITAALSAGPAIKPLPIGLLFPGQGSQYVKMMSGLKDNPAVKAMLKKADDILGYDVLALCLSGPESKLEETATCQPAMFIAGMAGLEKLRGEKEEAVTRAQVMAGLSLGEYTALCAAGVFSFEDGLKLVKLRGQAMSEAASASKQLMLSVAGLDKPKLQELCAEAAKKEGSGAVCQIANELFPKGFSVAGTEKAILGLKDLADKAGALQAKVLKTSGGFHTPLMKPAQDKLGKLLDEMLPSMNSPKCTVYMNATAAPMRPGSNPKEIVELLKKQLTCPVLWEPSVKGMIKEGVSEFYEVGPMKQIKAMMKRIDSKIWATTSNVEV